MTDVQFNNNYDILDYLNQTDDIKIIKHGLSLFQQRIDVIKQYGRQNKKLCDYLSLSCKLLKFDIIEKEEYDQYITDAINIFKE